jgi:hypothetical protein
VTATPAGFARAVAAIGREAHMLATDLLVSAVAEVAASELETSVCHPGFGQPPLQTALGMPCPPR